MVLPEEDHVLGRQPKSMASSDRIRLDVVLVFIAHQDSYIDIVLELLLGRLLQMTADKPIVL